MELKTKAKTETEKEKIKQQTTKTHSKTHTQLLENKFIKLEWRRDGYLTHFNTINKSMVMMAFATLRTELRTPFPRTDFFFVRNAGTGTVTTRVVVLCNIKTPGKREDWKSRDDRR